MPISMGYGGRVHVDGNTTDGYNGILLSTISGQNPTTDTNTVRLRKTESGVAQYGIKHQNCATTSIYKNTVTGLMMKTPGDSMHVGIYVSATTNANVQCNITSAINVAYMFTGACSNAKWWNNTMANSSYYGLYLNHSGALMGRQYYHV